LQKKLGNNKNKFVEIAAFSQSNMSAKGMNLQNLPYVIDESPRSQAAIGVVVLATDHVIEGEFSKIIQQIPGVTLHHSRIRNETHVTRETLSAMEERLEEAVSLILPNISLDVIAYGCTSASMVIGPKRVEERCQKAKPGVKVTNPFSAVIFAIKTMGLKRISLVTPYSDDLNQQLKSYLEKESIGIAAIASFNVDDDNIVGRISPESIEDACLKVGVIDTVEGVFVSCTNMRIAERIPSLEKRLGKPVTSSNHAMAWHALHLAGVRHPGSESRWGSLYGKSPK